MSGVVVGCWGYYARGLGIETWWKQAEGKLVRVKVVLVLHLKSRESRSRFIMSDSPVCSSTPADGSVPSEPVSQPAPINVDDHPSENIVGSEQATETNSGEAKLRSPFWGHYNRVKINGEWKACCKYCPAKISGKTENGTSHLQQHYNRKHKKKDNMR
ncbi:hypothetical protein Vadar_005431 [Vaccinium darrowii]|uniref:Uncharacterized protein n=1 Tax=Vaccinium darrowii TaxID=229202 RepID=A0ACB7XYE3_9ERIC|nr:hypothetical protein Vadar_005431 [Vaccinium darrowii]